MADTDHHEVIAFDLYCPECGYNLRGLTGDKCPECGASIAELRSGPSNIPWVYRRNRGRIRAYWRTVFWVIRRPEQFGLELTRSVSYRDAQRFRWVTILHAQGPLLLATVLATVGASSGWISDADLLRFIKPVWPGLLANLLFAAWLVVATGIPSYFFDYRDQPVPRRNSAIALSYYCCGPLALLPLAPAMTLLDGTLPEMRRTLSTVLTLAGELLPYVVLIVWWINLKHAARQAMPQQRWRRQLLQIGVPLLWVGATALIMILANLLIFHPLNFAASVG